MNLKNLLRYVTVSAVCARTFRKRGKKLSGKD